MLFCFFFVHNNTGVSIGGVWFVKVDAASADALHLAFIYSCLHK